jgi:DNA-binding CsgD family transcriptional regulator
MTLQTGRAEMPMAEAEQEPGFERRHSTGMRASRLLERDQWRDELAATFAGLLPPAAVIIEGAPGLGKTALLNAACHLASEAGHEVLRARGSAREAGVPFGILRQLLQTVQAKMSPTEREMCARTLGEPEAEFSPPILFDTNRALHLSLSQLASRLPLLIAIDDLHWSDIESLTWVQYMVRRLEPGRLSFVGSSTSRVAGTPLATIDHIISEPSTRVFSLRPLTEKSVARLVSWHLGVDADASFVAACHRMTGGNPFLLHSVLVAVTQERNIADLSDASLGALSPPPVIRAVLERLNGLPAEAHALLQSVAVLGDGADHRIVAALAGVDATMDSEMAAALSEVHLLRSGRTLSFVHPLERLAVYNEIGPLRCAQAHAEAARLLHSSGASLEEVSHHLLLSEPSDDEWCADVLERVARIHIDRGQHEAAQRCLSRALVESFDTALRPRRLLALSTAEAAMGQPAGLAHLREAADLGADPIELAEATFRCLKSFAQDSYPTETVPTLRYLGKHLGDASPDIRIWIEIVLATCGDHARGLPSSSPAMESVLAKSRSERSRLDRMALAQLSYGYSLAPDRLTADDVGRLAEEAIVPIEFQPEDDTTVVVTARALLALASVGRFDVITRLGPRLQAAAVSAGQIMAVAELSTALAYAQFLQGNLDQAEVEYHRARQAAGVRSWALRPMAIGVFAACLLEQGRSTDAATVLRNAIPNSRPESYAELMPLEQRTRLKLLEGLTDDALEDALMVQQCAHTLGVLNPATTSWRATTSGILDQLGRSTEARHLAAENLELARAFGATRTLGLALRTAALVGQPADRLALLQEAVDVLQHSGASLELAKATIELGSALIGEGRHDESLPALRLGADLAYRCRAQPLAERAARELRAAGARPRRLALMGTDALTPAERRVAELAADGLINARIAEKLFVSEKTVEGHLTRVYQKLGRQSRIDLKDLLNPSSELSSVSGSPALERERRAV